LVDVVGKLTTINSVVCPYCGCLCDDIELTVEDGTIKKMKNGCFLSKAKFMNFNNKHRITKPLIRKNGKLTEASLEEAIHKSAKILANATYPVLYGWSSTSCEAQKVGVELAEQIGGVFDNTSSVCHGPSVLAMQEVGLPSCTLGQVKHRADLILYWGCDPLSSHPRHMQRYTIFTERTFKNKARKPTNKNTIKTGKEKKLGNSQLQVEKDNHSSSCVIDLEDKPRKLVVIDVRKTSTAAVADLFLQIEPNKDFEVIQTLRMLINDQEIEVDNIGGTSVNCLKEIADALVNCSFGVIFYGMGLAQSEGKHRNIEAAIKLVRDLNERTKFSIMPMKGHFNVSGADIVSAWQTGYPFGVDFSLGYPRYNPGETTVVEILLRHESDAFMAVASDPVAGFPKLAVKHLIKNPLIVIDPHLNATSLMADVVFPCAIAGIETEGSAYRMDQVPLPLKKVIQPPNDLLNDKEILSRILQEIKSLRTLA
jgi:formylmethanofuran dehydrogenase subunit B